LWLSEGKERTVQFSKGPAQSAVIDWDSLWRSSMDDRELASELIELFLADTPPQLETLHRCIEEADSEATRRSAHALKGGCLTIGAGRMAEVCQQLELACQGRSFDDLGRLGETLSREFEEAKSQLRAGPGE
jgi:HPt (histidine-containing phosphotransfer) domain-containing protein